jgi:hypothetical protein
MRVNGGIIGAQKTPNAVNASGIWSISDAQQANGSAIWPGGSIITSGLILLLDAANPSSYSGTGSIWYDVSGNNNNFNVLASAFVFNGLRSYFNFNGTYGQAKNSSDISLSGDVTYLVVTRIKNSTAEWRTLTRSYVNDHHVIVQSGDWNVGMYDNDGAAFISTGYSQQSLPGYSSNQFDVMCWRWTNSDNPTYDFNVNGTQRGTITNSNARYNRGFGCIGGYHNGNTDPTSGSQYWGDIHLFAAYNRRLSNDEVTENYSRLRRRFLI